MENLPKKWYIIRNKDNHVVLNNWHKENIVMPSGYDHPYMDDTGYFYSDRRFGKEGGVEKGYTEITFEQFIKYIINKEPQTTEYLIHN